MDIKVPSLVGSTPDKIARQAVKILLANKGINTQLFDVSDTTVIADYYVISTGRSTTHIKSLSDELIDKLSSAGISPSHVEGRGGGEWILIDFDNVIVHIFGKEAREFYTLERLLGNHTDIADIEEELDREMSASE